MSKFKLAALLVVVVGSLFARQNPPPPRKSSPPGRVDLSGGAVYWRSKQSGLRYTNRVQSVFTTADFSTSSLVRPDFDWSAGLALAGEYGFPDSYWSFGLSLLYYQGVARGTQIASNNYGMFPVLSFADTTLPGDYVTGSDMKWWMNAVLFDAKGAYEGRCSSWFTLVPVIALRNAWLNQRLDATYSGGTFSGGDDVVSLRGNFYGIGPMVGLIPTFIVNEYFSIYGKASVAYLWGWFDVDQTEAFASVEIERLSRNPSGGRWNGDFSIGMKFGRNLTKRIRKLKRIDIDLGFDYLFFTKQYEFVHGPEFSVPRSGHNLTMYGVHAIIGAHF